MGRTPTHWRLRSQCVRACGQKCWEFRRQSQQTVSACPPCACACVLFSGKCSAADFVLLGGDSLSALAVVKKLVEWDGGEWPADGVVRGPLAPHKLCENAQLRAYSTSLVSAGVTMRWLPPDASSGKIRASALPSSCSGVGVENGKETGDKEQSVVARDKAGVVEQEELQRRLRHAAARGREQEAQSLLAARASPGEGRDVVLSALHVAANAGEGTITCLMIMDVCVYACMHVVRMCLYLSTSAYKEQNLSPSTDC